MNIRFADFCEHIITRLFKKAKTLTLGRNHLGSCGRRVWFGAVDIRMKLLWIGFDQGVP